MRHLKSKRKLGVKSQHRKALLCNLMRGLVFHKRIRTTLCRAKETSSYADKMVQLAKRGDLHARRLLLARLRSEDVVRILMRDIAPQFKSRNGGYTRVLRLNARPGDASPMAFLEFTETIAAPSRPEKKAKPKKAKPEGEKKLKEQAKPEAKAKGSEKKAAQEAPKTPDDKKESEKKGGFLGALRKFLKGD